MIASYYWQWYTMFSWKSLIMHSIDHIINSLSTSSDRPVWEASGLSDMPCASSWLASMIRRHAFLQRDQLNLHAHAWPPLINPSPTRIDLGRDTVHLTSYLSLAWSDDLFPICPKLRMTEWHLQSKRHLQMWAKSWRRSCKGQSSLYTVREEISWKTPKDFLPN